MRHQPPIPSFRIEVVVNGGMVQHHERQRGLGLGCQAIDKLDDGLPLDRFRRQRGVDLAGRIVQGTNRVHPMSGATGVGEMRLAFRDQARGTFSAVAKPDSSRKTRRDGTGQCRLLGVAQVGARRLE